MDMEALDRKVAEEIERQLSSLQKTAADRQDRVALHLLDAAWSMKDDPYDPERLTLLFMVKMRLQGCGAAAGKVAVNALVKLSALMGGM